MGSCEWCASPDTSEGRESVYWELPDGSGAVEITETPTIICANCSMKYQNEKLIKEIEDQLFLIDTARLEKTIKFRELMKLPRRLKRNYFDFT